MDSIFEHYKKTGYMHHAHIIEGQKKEIVPVLLSALEQHLGISAQGNPDFTILEYQSLGIDESRDLSLRQSRSGFNVPTNKTTDGFSRRIFIISAESFTHEAQNALLKTFEEPTPHTHFFVIIPRLHILIPTLASRALLLRREELFSPKDEAEELAEKFLDTSLLTERFAFIKKLTETKKGEVIDREKIRRILDYLERMLYTRLAGKESAIRGRGDIFRDIYKTKTYLADRGSSPKMLLEYLAIELS
ncbi:MAG: hypothetical protein HY228_00010 [Candidatus Yonathbacteria bacterium]|nr:hypothetical protein [Candidatus Yonathbacteria bacterium]